MFQCLLGSDESRAMCSGSRMDEMQNCLLLSSEPEKAATRVTQGGAPGKRGSKLERGGSLHMASRVGVVGFRLPVNRASEQFCGFKKKGSPSAVWLQVLW